MQRSIPATLVLVIVLAVTGCGSSEPTTTADWANGVCTSINTWVASIKSSVSEVTAEGLSSSSIQSAGDELQSATDELESDLKDLDRPDTEAGEQAKTSIDQLSSDLKTGAESINTAIDDVSDVSSAIAAASIVGTTLTTMKNQVTSTYNSLKQLDTGELQSAFEQSSACTELVNQLSALTTQLSGSG